jgi:hypothetical protein
VSERRLQITPFALSAIAAAALLSACTSESYYCDDTGCYFCDGVGCREVDPPDRPSCRGDFECPEGSMCTDLGCVEGCSSDEQCPAGTECREGMCIAPSENPTPNPGTCTTSADCEGEDLECIDGVCEIGTGPAACDSDDDCGSGEVCVAGECRADDQTCQFSSECGEGRVCVNERCTTACSDSNPCGAGQICQDGFCVEDLPTSECTVNADCGEGRICVDGTCFDECTEATEATDCDDGFYCLLGRCRFDDRPRPFCESDADCTSPAVCRNGVCRSPCTEHAECPAFDVSLQFCLDMVCATTNEATSNCTEASDCEAGESCVDGNCS